MHFFGPQVVTQVGIQVEIQFGLMFLKIYFANEILR